MSRVITVGAAQMGPIQKAESRAADDKAREILSGEAPGRGASDQRHWGMAQILWATQGGLRIEQLAPGTRATIQDALGAQIAGPGIQGDQLLPVPCDFGFEVAAPDPLVIDGRFATGDSFPIGGDACFGLPNLFGDVARFCLGLDKPF